MALRAGEQALDGGKPRVSKAGRPAAFHDPCRPAAPERQGVKPAVDPSNVQPSAQPFLAWGGVGRGRWPCFVAQHPSQCRGTLRCSRPSPSAPPESVPQSDNKPGTDRCVKTCRAFGKCSLADSLLTMRLCGGRFCHGGRLPSEGGHAPDTTTTHAATRRYCHQPCSQIHAMMQ